MTLILMDYFKDNPEKNKITLDNNQRMYENELKKIIELLGRNNVFLDLNSKEVNEIILKPLKKRFRL